MDTVTTDVYGMTGKWPRYYEPVSLSGPDGFVDFG